MDGDAIENLRRADAKIAAERARQDRATPSTLGSALHAAIAAASAVAIASDEDLARIDAEAERQAWADRLEVSGVHGATRVEDRRMLLRGKLQQVPALRATQAWLAKAMGQPPGRNVLVMCGSTGLGKTLAAAWAISREGGIYAKVDELVRDYARWDRDRTAYDRTADHWRRYQRAHLVVLDELGRERDANLARDAVYKLADERQSRRRQLTIIITNLSKPDLLARLHAGVYDERTASRWARDAWVVQVDGADQRRRDS